MDHKQLKDLQELRAAEAASEWYGWGSPIGLSIFFLTLVGIVVIIKIVFFG
jgi:hypothetical protein